MEGKGPWVDEEGGRDGGGEGGEGERRREDVQGVLSVLKEVSV